MKQAIFVNCTPHAVVLNSGEIFPASGNVARVEDTYTEPDHDGVCTVEYGDIVGLPEPQENTLFIVSALVLAANKAAGDNARTDLVAPATGHRATVRVNGQVQSVPCFVR